MGTKLFKRSLAIALTAAVAGSTLFTNDFTAKAAVKNDETVRDDISSIEFTKDMGNGINLGNTMEAYNHALLESSSGEITPEMVTKCETAWGQPVTTQSMVDGMKEMGFDTIRIPVAWTNLMDYENGNYTIPEAYLDRVKEIVDYARNDDMYVIINDHWDGGWWGMFGQKGETAEKAWTMYEDIWTQVSTEFKDYGDHVIFESANEELGDRLNDKWPADTGSAGTLSVDECYSTMNAINQKFVDIVRKTGGNNDKRFLLIAGYDTNIDKTIDSHFKMPDDTASDKLLVSVHFYDPSDYCIGTVNSWGRQSDYQKVNDTLAKMKAFTDKGIGVVIGEYGPQNHDGETTLKKGAIPAYIKNILNNCDYYGYCPVLWDANYEYDRDNSKARFDETAEIFKSHSKAFQAGKSDEEIKEAAKKEMDADLEAAPSARVIPDDEAFSWLMYASSDWGKMYSVGDNYDENSVSAGVTATTVDVTGEGEYTVGLDFTNSSDGCAKDMGFAAVGIMHGEQLYPNYSVLIENININGENVELTGKPYTCSDDGKCTRVNISNPYIKEKDYPEGYSAVIVDTLKIKDVRTISVTYKFVNSDENRVKKDDKNDPAEPTEPTDTKSNAWLMYANSDWSVTAGTTSDFSAVSDNGGIKSSYADIDGEGWYTVSLDFSGTSETKTSDLNLLELVVGKSDNFADYKIVPKRVLVNDKEINLTGEPQTGIEDGAFRLYLNNPWGSDALKVVSPDDFKDVRTFTVTFMFSKDGREIPEKSEEPIEVTIKHKKRESKLYCYNYAGELVKNSIVRYRNKLYASDGEGALIKNNLVTINGKTYLAGKSGALKKNSWVTFKNMRYYVDENCVVTKVKPRR